MLHLQMLFNKVGDMAVVEEEKKVDNEVAGGLDVLGWWCTFPSIPEKNLSIAHSATTPALQLVISDNTCWDIQEKGIQMCVV